MKKFIAIAALMAFAGGAQAATQSFQAIGGNWDSLTTWSGQVPNGSVSTAVYDAGDAIPLISGILPFGPDTCGGGCGPTPAQSPTGTGTYLASFTYDDVTGEVLSGSMTMTGTISTQVQGTWWQFDYNNTVWSFDNPDPVATTHSSTTCHEGIGNPAPCYFAPFAPFGGIGAGILDMSDGNLGNGGAAQFAATFDGVDQLEIFSEGYTPGSDYLKIFTLTPVPIPAAVWLFGSALGLLGFARRRKA